MNILRQQTSFNRGKTKNLAAYMDFNWMLKKQDTTIGSEYDSMLDNQSVTYKDDEV